MAGIKELRLRIKSLKNTSKITAAMKMVSAAKLKKAQDAFARTKPYAVRLKEMFQRVLATLDSVHHQLPKARPNSRTRYVVIPSARAPAGASNSGLFRTFARRPADTVPVEALGVGRRAREFIKRANGT